MKKMLLSVAVLTCFMSAKAQTTFESLRVNLNNTQTSQHYGNFQLGLADVVFDSNPEKNGDWGTLQIKNWQSNGTYTNSLRIQSNGNVVLGTPVAGATGVYRLNVWGRARANEIVVNTNGADFVFADNYRLRPLKEVEQFIATNKHLPEIPSAKEMQENGMAVGELQTKLLQKVEELTLYVIELQKENQAQQQEIQALKGQAAAPKK